MIRTPLLALLFVPALAVVQQTSTEGSQQQKIHQPQHRGLVGSATISNLVKPGDLTFPATYQEVFNPWGDGSNAVVGQVLKENINLTRLTRG